LLGNESELVNTPTIELPSEFLIALNDVSLASLSLSLILRPTVSQPFCLGIKHPSGAYDQVFITVRQLRVVDVERSL
jgi:hypothetical protein